jgi:hypothetical protein
MLSCKKNLFSQNWSPKRLLIKTRQVNSLAVVKSLFVNPQFNEFYDGKNANLAESEPFSDQTAHKCLPI